MPNCNLDESYMNIAKEIAKRSYAKRLKVGAVLVKNNRIISDGYNGMPYGFPNTCETDGCTNKEVLHAESNAITKIAKSNYSSDGSTLYVTTSPCIDCAKLIIQSGIVSVYFENLYRKTDGLDLMVNANIDVYKKDKETNTFKKYISSVK